MAEEQIQVAVRIRPPSDKKKSSVWHVSQRERDDDTGEKAYCLKQKGLKHKKEYVFDHVYGPDSQQEVIFDECIKPIVERTLDGYNSTIFAYGSTGSGKTYTVMGPKDDPGVIPRTVDHVFKRIVELREKKRQNFMVMVTYIEIYKERVRDLLSSKSSYDTPLDVHELPDGSFVVPGATTEAVSSKRLLMKKIREGSNHRMTSATLQNDVSSRSHAILTITVESSGSATSKLNIVDLAGSERFQNAGESKHQETKAINQSLYTLSRVIHTLSERSAAKSKKKKKNNNTSLDHIPYRDSNLTRLLKDALGGNAMTLMLACMHPDGDNLTETVSTLGYALRSKSITNVVSKNQARKTLMSRMKDEIRRLNMMANENQDVAKRLLEIMNHYTVGEEAGTMNNILALIRTVPTGDSAPMYESREAAAVNLERQLENIHFMQPKLSLDEDDLVLDHSGFVEDEDLLLSGSGQKAEDTRLHTDIPPYTLFRQDIMVSFCQQVLDVGRTLSDQ